VHGSWTSRVTSVVHQHLAHLKTLVTWVNHFGIATYLNHLAGLVWDQPPVQWLCGLPRVKRPCLKLTTRLRLVSSVRMSRGAPPGPPYAFLACVLVALFTCRVSQVFQQCPSFPACTSASIDHSALCNLLPVIGVEVDFADHFSSDRNCTFCTDRWRTSRTEEITLNTGMFQDMAASPDQPRWRR
jgi:hypothetical protein